MCDDDARVRVLCPMGEILVVRKVAELTRKEVEHWKTLEWIPDGDQAGIKRGTWGRQGVHETMLTRWKPLPGQGTHRDR